MKNKKRLITLIIVIAVISLINVSNVLAKQKDNNSIEEIKNRENIVFLGDSITDWYPIKDVFGDLPIVRSGVAGYKTTDILDRMNEMVYRYNPTKVFLLIGTNDLNVEGMDRDDVINKIQTIFLKIKKKRKNAKLYYQTIYPVNDEANNSSAQNRKNEDIQYVNRKMKKFCKENNITYINMYDLLINSDGKFNLDYTNDGLHPNDLGYARISQYLLRYIYDIE